MLLEHASDGCRRDAVIFRDLPQTLALVAIGKDSLAIHGQRHAPHMPAFKGAKSQRKEHRKLHQIAEIRFGAALLPEVHLQIWQKPSPMSAAVLRNSDAIWPMPTAQWWAGPLLFQASMKLRAPSGKR